MVENILVKDSRVEGAAIIRALIDAGIPVKAAFWSYYGLYERWEFYIVSPWVDEKGLNTTFSEIGDAISENKEIELLSLTDIRLIGLKESYYELYLNAEKNHQQSLNTPKECIPISGPDYQFYVYNLEVVKEHSIH
jgi:hypothetical protein